MTTSEKGYSFIEGQELYRQFVYMDDGHPAIGYGHDLQYGESFPDGIDRPSAVLLLRKDLTTRFEPPLNLYVAHHGITLTQGQWDAWVDFSYNLGPFAGITMMAHGVAQVPTQMPRWVSKRVNGVLVQDPELLKRRQAEVKLWNS